MGWLALGTVLPLVTVLERRSITQCWACLALFCAVYMGAGTYWTALSGPRAWWIPVVIALYGQLFIPVPLALLAAAGRQRHSSNRLVLLPAGFMLAELIARLVLARISWMTIGAPLADYSLFAQLASLAGPEALTFVVVSVDVAVITAYRERGWKVPAVVQALVVILITVAWGAFRLWPTGAPVSMLRAGVVQPAIRNSGWHAADGWRDIIAQLQPLVRAAGAGHPDLIVLPEGSVPGPLRAYAELDGFLPSEARRGDVPILAGSLDSDESTGSLYNAAILTTPSGAMTEYRKIRPVPITEYSVTPLALRRVGRHPEFRAGADRVVFPLADGRRFSAMICVEDSMPELARDFANAGAGALVALLSTGRFEGTPEGLQHLRRARLTAIAAGLPMLRAANTGISCAIDNRGRVLSALPESECTTGILTVPYSNLPGPYRRFGDAGVVSLVGLFAIALIAYLGLANRAGWALPRSRLQRRPG